MRINRHDTNGTKPLLAKGELGYDDYSAGGDTGRVYIGTGTENIALAERLESNMMTKAQFNALAEERKANRAGSGFDEWGKHTTSNSVINQGLQVPINPVQYQGNTLYLGQGTYNPTGISTTSAPYVCINGVKQKIDLISRPETIYERNIVLLPTAPNIYPHDTVLTPEQIASGVIKHADASNSGLIVNGKFNTDTSGWTSYYASGSIASVSGVLRATNNTNIAGASQTISTVVGKKYTVAIDVVTLSGTAMIYGVGAATGADALANGFISTTGRKIIEFTATSTTTWIIFRTNTTTNGLYVELDNISVYPADAISRSDLVFLESWHEDISEKNFVYPLGNTQYLGSNTDGLTGIANGAFTGFETYSLFGKIVA